MTSFVAASGNVCVSQLCTALEVQADATAAAAPSEDILASLISAWANISDPEKDGEPVVVALAHLLASSGTPKLVDSLMAAIDSRPGLSLDTRFAMAAAVFSEPDLTTGEQRLAVFQQAARYACSAGGSNLRILLRQLEDIEGASSSWGLSPAAARQLYTTLADVAAAAGKKLQEMHFLLQGLKAVDQSCAGDVSVSSMGVRAVSVALLLPSFFEYDRLLSCPGIKALESTSEAWAFKLLSVFYECNIAGLPAVVAEAGGKLEANGLSSEVLQDELRMLSLCTLCCQSASFTYEEASKALGVPLEEVERWVVRAVRAGAVQVKMNQPQGIVNVKSALPLRFDRAEWSKLAARLSDWRKRLEGLSSSVSANLVLNTAPAAGEGPSSS